MITEESKNTISYRLFKENICAAPLDEHSLDTIEQYMLYRKSCSDLCRRLSDIELNYVQITSEAEDASESLIYSREALIATLRNLTDKWRELGYLNDFLFTSGDDNNSQIQHTYTTALERIKALIKVITDNLLIVSETAAQIRACSASFTEVYKESRLAIYAMTLNRDIDSVLDCRSTSLQAHASATECQRTSSSLLGIARACTRIISLVNNMILETTQILDLDDYESIGYKKLSPLKASSIISNTIVNLENATIELH